MQNGDRLVREENARRKQHRILQVREQSKEIAAKLRKRISDEQERQKDHVEKVKIDELRKWRDNRVSEQQCNYDRIIGSTLDANEEARREVEANHQHRKRKQELDLMAVQRGRTALRKEVNANLPKLPNRKPRSKSTEMQTENICMPRNGPEARHIGVNTEQPPDQCLAPESPECDENVVISDRSVDILEKSKRFVENANRRLDEISAKVAQCARQQSPVKQATPAAATKTVRSNITTKLRAEQQRRPAVAPKPVNRPRKVIPSVKEPAQTSSGVSCYDHPNRFTKNYAIPKNIVVKSNLMDHNNEDDAVTNALNETHEQIAEDKCQLERSKELRQKEAIRELGALEKSQVRRDYEMLAKTLEEVRKNRNASPSSTTNHHYVNGDVSVGRTEASTHIPKAQAFNEILHLPIRISCPKVQGQLNVGDTVYKGEFSGSDSAKSIVLDQVVAQSNTDRNNQPEVGMENKETNVKVQAVSNAVTGSSREPIKIIIQVENLNGDCNPTRTVELKLPQKIGVVNESLSTNYMSPPSEVATQLERFLKPKPKAVKTGKKSVPGKPANSELKGFISKLLQMPQTDVEKLVDIDVSDLTTPNDSILNVETNKPIYDGQKLSSVSRLIEDNYSILEEVNDLIAQHSRSEHNSGEASSAKAVSTNSLMLRYATMSQTYNDRIHSLNNMIKVIRAEKQSLMHENGISNVTTSERDTSTKYKDFGPLARTITPSGSDMSTDGEILSGSHQIKKAQATRLGTNKVIGLSRDSGISMSRPVTSTDVREQPDERTFEPMLKDIPKARALEVEVPVMKRPPNSITRYSPEAIQAPGHDLSTIIEVETSATVPVGSQEPMPPELKKFPTMEEFVTQNATNTSLQSEGNRPEVVPVKPFVSFKHFVETNGPVGEGSLCNDIELNLSEIAQELRRRSLLASNDCSGSENVDHDEGKKYIQSLSRELEEIIMRINSQAPKEPNGSQVSVGSILSDCGAANETSIGQLLDKIQPSRFPTREEFNMQNNSKHYKSADILKSFLDVSKGGYVEVEKLNNRQSSPQKLTRVRSEGAVPRGTGDDPGKIASRGSLKRSSDSPKSQTLNLSDDLINALENNLGEMGLKWAVNMLKRSHLQISSSTSGASSSENVSKEAIPFESKTISLLTDLEKSSISDESKTSNIKNIILRELIRNQSENSSSNGSLESGGILGRRRRLKNDSNSTESDDGRCLRTSTPVHSNIFTSISSSTLVDRGEKTVTAVDISDCLFSGESKLSSVRDDVATLSNFRLDVPGTRLDVGKYSKPPDFTTSTEYSLNEHNKRKMTTRRVDK